ncbi:MAG: LamG domain-containing protein [Acidovorax sp.]|nr:LamG domain-containing protein [Acidovorax sp.]
MAGDAFYGSVGLLLHGDGANESTTFTDSSNVPKLVTAFGNAQISTAQSLFGGASMLFDGSGDYLNLANSADFSFGTGDFCIEFSTWRSSNKGDCIVVHNTADASATAGWWVNFSSDNFVVYNNSSLIISVASASLAGAAWKRWAVSRSGTTVRVFRDGVRIGESTSSASFDSSLGLQVGGHTSFGGFDPWFNGYIDELRITKGQARRVADYTPDAQAFPDYAYRLSGNVKDASGANAARRVIALSEPSEVVVGATTSNATTGDYSIDTLTNEAHTLNFYPLSGEDLPVLTLGKVIPV